MSNLLRRVYHAILQALGQDSGPTYNKDSDPIFHRYERLDKRVEVLHRAWKPRDLLEL